MEVDAIRAELDQEPFVPFRLHLSDGKTFDVPFRAVAHIVVGGLLVFVRLKEGTVSAEGYKHFGFDQVLRIEARPALGGKRKKAS